MTRIVEPAKKTISGELSLPGDKSIAHRALILGTLAAGTLELTNLPTGRDVFSTRECLELMGAKMDGVGTRVKIEGLGLRGLLPPAARLDCGNSGTTMRLLLGVCAGQPRETVFSGDASLSRRPMKRVTDPLSRMGAKFTLADGGRPPVRVRGRHPLAPVRIRLEVPSAQVKSAILLAGLFADGQTAVEDPFKTRDHTERMLRFFGGGQAVETRNDSVSVRPFQLRSDTELKLPGDISSAAYFAAAALLLPGSQLLLQGVLLNPTRMGFFDRLSEMGARFTTVVREDSGGEPVGDIQLHAGSLKGITVGAEDIPSLVDEVPLLAVVAAGASGETRIEGLGELRVKESDRLTGTLAGLRAMGADAAIDGDALVLAGGSRFTGGAILTHGDHRLAMAFAVAALTARGNTTIHDADCAAVSFPGFFDTLEGLTA